MKNLLLSLCCISIILIEGCSLFRAEDTIYDHHYLYRYSENTDTTIAAAWFSFPGVGGSALLDQNESIEANFVPMQHGIIEIDNNYEYYAAAIAGDPEWVEFAFTPLSGDVVVTKFDRLEIPTIGMPEIADAIPLDHNWKISWIGDPLKQDEVVRVFLSDGYHYNALYFSETGATSVTIQYYEMSDFYPGDPITVTLRRSYSRPFTTGDTEGDVSYTYEAADVIVDTE